MGQNGDQDQGTTAMIAHEICIYLSVVKPVVINCNDDNLLLDLMLHKLSMINVIKFHSLVWCGVWRAGIRPPTFDEIVEFCLEDAWM